MPQLWQGLCGKGVEGSSTIKHELSLWDVKFKNKIYALQTVFSFLSDPRII